MILLFFLFCIMIISILINIIPIYKVNETDDEKNYQKLIGLWGSGKITDLSNNNNFSISTCKLSKFPDFLLYFTDNTCVETPGITSITKFNQTIKYINIVFTVIIILEFLIGLFFGINPFIYVITILYPIVLFIIIMQYSNKIGNYKKSNGNVTKYEISKFYTTLFYITIIIFMLSFFIVSTNIKF